jgi:hypothetical protein
LLEQPGVLTSRGALGRVADRLPGGLQGARRGVVTPGSQNFTHLSAVPGLFIPVFGAADFDLELIESRALDGHIQELIYRPALHA